MKKSLACAVAIATMGVAFAQAPAVDAKKAKSLFEGHECAGCHQMDMKIVGPGLKNGDWVYSAYLADGKVAPDPIAACRGCHLPLGDAKDYFHRYDEYLAKKKS